MVATVDFDSAPDELLGVGTEVDVVNSGLLTSLQPLDSSTSEAAAPTKADFLTSMT